MSEMILSGNLCSITTSLKNKLVTLVASLVVRKGIKLSIFENLSTTMKIDSLPFHVFGKTITKFMLTESQGLFGIGKGVYDPMS